MKATITRQVEQNITHVRVALAVRYGEEDMPNNFPVRTGGLWRAEINIDTGKIENWPADFGAFELYMKVCDSGSYYLLDGNTQIAAIEGDYVPNGVVPGEYGDYVDLKIAADGTITNWPKKPDVSSFFPERD